MRGAVGSGKSGLLLALLGELPLRRGCVRIDGQPTRCRVGSSCGCSARASLPLKSEARPATHTQAAGASPERARGRLPPDAADAADADAANAADAAALGQLERRGAAIAYVGQEPALFQGSVRENITFGLPFRRERFRRVCEVCQLAADLAAWPLREHTPASAITVSGGQRARIALARAAYCFDTAAPELSPEAPAAAAAATASAAGGERSGAAAGCGEGVGSDRGGGGDGRPAGGGWGQLVLLDDVLAALDPKVSRRVAADCVHGFMRDEGPCPCAAPLMLL